MSRPVQKYRTAPPARGRDRRHPASDRNVLRGAALLTWGVAVLIVPGVPSYASDLTRSAALIDDALAALGFDPSHKQALFQGKTLHRGLPRLERQPGELAVGSVMHFVRRSLHEVDQEYLSDASLRANSAVLDFAPIPGDATEDELATALRGIAFSEKERGEAGKLARFDGGSRFNLSQGEIERLQSLGGAASLAMVSETYRGLLLDRLQAYRKRGLEAVASYDRGGKANVAPGSELLTALHSMEFVEQHFPEFHRALLAYPAAPGENTVDDFHWLKREVSGRVLFALAHRVTLLHEDYSMSAELQFYAGHSFNSMLTLIGCFPVEGGTVVFCTVRLFTDKVKGFGSSLKKKVGRRTVGKAVAEYFEELRDVLESEVPADETH